MDWKETRERLLMLLPPGTQLPATWQRGFEINLGQACLKNADLEEANLGGAYLRAVDLRGANLRNAYLRGADLTLAKLQNTILAGADLRNAELGWANAHGANLRGTDLHGAFLRGSDLSKANLHGSNLFGADLSGSCLNKADLGMASMQGADLHGADLCGITVCWLDFTLISEILWRAAGEDLDHQMFAALIGRQTKWLWSDFLAVEHPSTEWAIGVLRLWVKEGDNAPEFLKNRFTRRIW